MNSISYGPVPSRRLGRSLGINNIPPKICTYACVYCQLGKTINMQVDRATFYRNEFDFGEEYGVYRVTTGNKLATLL